MALAFLDNINYVGQSPNFERDQFETLAAMKSYSENYLPNMFIATCIETGKIYLYNVENTVDEIMGKWREVGNAGDDPGKLTADIISAFNVGGVEEKETFAEGTSLEEVIKKILVGTVATTHKSYYGVVDTMNKSITGLTEVDPVSNFSISITADNQYVVIVCPIDAGDVTIMSNGFDYTTSFVKITEGDYNYYYSETKVTCIDFDYTVTYN